MRRRDRTARPLRVEHYSSAVNSPSRCDGRLASTCSLKVLYYGFFFSAPVSLAMPEGGFMQLKGFQHLHVALVV